MNYLSRSSIYIRTLGKTCMIGVMVPTSILMLGCKESGDENGSAGDLLVGLWSDGCQPDLPDEDDLGGVNSEPKYAVTALKFESVEFVYEKRSYSDTGCTTQTGGQKIDGTYLSGDPTAKPGTSVEGATPIDISVRTVWMATNKQTVLNDIIEFGECPTPPALGEYFDISTCPFVEKQADDEGVPKKGSTWYMIFKGGLTELYWGDDEDKNFSGSTPEKRPLKLESKTFKKTK